jgi:iron(II)-dependent oxidoreductase
VAPGTERSHRAGITLVYVPGGEYVIGATDITTFRSQHVHPVRLSPFWIGKTPVTNEQYHEFLKANPTHPPPEFWDDERFNEPRQPVVGVTWYDAKAYCEWAGLALTSEAQWEAAARGTDRRRYPWGNDPPTEERANYGMRIGKTTAVDGYPAGAGPFGTLEQAGNAAEWCADVYNRNAYEGQDGAVDPVSTAGWKGFYTVRGGSWFYPERYLPSGERFPLQGTASYQGVGFRCALTERGESAKAPGTGEK